MRILNLNQVHQAAVEERIRQTESESLKICPKTVKVLGHEVLFATQVGEVTKITDLTTGKTVVLFDVMDDESNEWVEFMTAQIVAAGGRIPSYSTDCITLVEDH